MTAPLLGAREVERCPPHDFGQNDDPPATLKEMLPRSCSKCGVSAAEVLGKMIAAEHRAPAGRARKAKR